MVLETGKSTVDFATHSTAQSSTSVQAQRGSFRRSATKRTPLINQAEKKNKVKVNADLIQELENSFDGSFESIFDELEATAKEMQEIRGMCSEFQAAGQRREIRLDRLDEMFDAQLEVDISNIFTEERINEIMPDLSERIDEGIAEQMPDQVTLKERINTAISVALVNLEEKIAEGINEKVPDLKKIIDKMIADGVKEQFPTDLAKIPMLDELESKINLSIQRLESRMLQLSEPLPDLEKRCIALEGRVIELRKESDQYKQETAQKALSAFSTFPGMKSAPKAAPSAAPVGALAEGAVVSMQNLPPELMTLEQRTFDRFAQIEKDLDRCFSHLESQHLAINGLQVRRMEWSIANCKAQLAHLDNSKETAQPGTGSISKDSKAKDLKEPDKSAKEYRNWFSPKFDAAGLQDLQLELRRWKQQETVKGKSKGGDNGDMSVHLLCPVAATISFKVWIGSKSAMLERVFDGRAPHGSKRICMLAEEIDRNEGSLRVAVEIMEVWTQTRRSLTATDNCRLESTFTVQKHIRAPDYKDALTQKLVRPAHMLNAGCEPVGRRIEWHLPNASLLQQHFPNNSPMHSPFFKIGHIDHMQFIFYPCGTAHSSEGFCSLLLSCPGDLRLRGWLYVGQHQQELHPSLGADVMGEVNFCKLSSAIDMDDTVVLRLELSMYGLQEDPRELANRLQSGESVLKLQPMDMMAGRSKDGGKDGGEGSNIEEVQRLASLWSSTQAGASSLELMNSFSEISVMESGKSGSIADQVRLLNKKEQPRSTLKSKGSLHVQEALTDPRTSVRPEVSSMFADMFTSAFTTPSADTVHENNASALDVNEISVLGAKSRERDSVQPPQGKSAPIHSKRIAGMRRGDVNQHNIWAGEARDK
eukprot:gnl/MRDRNA2_/MRDRNA2_107439_c0_seq1.p1 gnl/MRDRNA2_/MRDRNA2_107439_c0~~gnl/MRDRNA2_/MRDRNA2_107439_c0_seq1.p1  ORF type:complete len:874 (+),score=175.93 gnl/MRDRNA2_/MRDRNA2_107439_c0_seq1:71-2692(+)